MYQIYVQNGGMRKVCLFSIALARIETKKQIWHDIVRMFESDKWYSIIITDKLPVFLSVARKQLAHIIIIIWTYDRQCRKNMREKLFSCISESPQILRIFPVHLRHWVYYHSFFIRTWWKKYIAKTFRALFTLKASYEWG